MSQITLQTLDFSSLGFPDVGYFYLGVDTDGIPKLRRHLDTIPLYATGSSVLSYVTTTALDFINLINTSSLNPGSVYLLSDFETKHYIQYTDSNLDGTANDELVNVGNIEPLVIVAISNSQYNIDVKSLSYPDDEIVWRHDLADREREYYNPGGLGKGHITFRKSANGNSRDYDFRNVIFRRWNDGSGNYTVVRAVDAPNIFDYIDFKSFEEGYFVMQNNEISSILDSRLDLSIPYYLDNLIISTSSRARINKIGAAHGVTINYDDFTANSINLFLFSNLNSPSNIFIYNRFDAVAQSSFFGEVTINESKLIQNSTFSNTFYANKIVGITDTILGTAQGNNLSGVDYSSIDNLNFNTGNVITESIISTFENNNFNTVNDSYITSFTFNDVNILGTNSIGTASGNIVNTITGNTVSVLDNNISSEIIDNMVPDITGNTVDSIYGNVLGDGSQIQYNIGTFLLFNIGTMSIINNKVNSLYDNTGVGLIGANDSDEIYQNTLNVNSTIGSNIVKLINTNIINDSISYNTGHAINDNTIDVFQYNNVNSVGYNTLGTFSYNIANQVTNNTFSQAIYNNITTISGNDVNTLEYYSGIIFESNVGNTYSYSQIDGTVNNNIDYVFQNKIYNLESNTITNVTSNNSYNILNNTASNISDNSVYLILSNMIDDINTNEGYSIFGNSGNTIEINKVFNISNNIVGTISNNDGKTIGENTLDFINANKFLSIQDNTGLVSTFSQITDNQVKEINYNTLFTDITNNSGLAIGSNAVNKIDGNSGFENILSNTGSIATFSFIQLNNSRSISYNNLFSTIEYNNVNEISSNTFNSLTYSQIYANHGVGIYGNINTSVKGNNVLSIVENSNVNIIEANKLLSINYNSNFNLISSSSGRKIKGCTGSTGSSTLILQNLRNVEMDDVLINTNIQNHTFLDYIGNLSLTASVDMRFATYSTVSRWVWDLSGHYEEKALSTGLTYSGPIA